MSRMRLGVVGCGDIAEVMGWFARFNRRIELAAACDVSGERARAYARRFNIPRTFTVYEEMLGQVDLDALYLAVPHHLHYEMMTTAVAQKLPVFTEKPITRTLAEGEKITRLAAEQGVKVGVNYQYRYDSGCHRMARAVQNGDLGIIHAARINVPWQRKASYFENAGWHGKIAMAGGGTLITQGSHFLDIVLWALQGDQPQTAMGYIAQRKFGGVNREQATIDNQQSRGIEVEDLAQGIVEMASGALIQICSSMIASSEQAVSVEMYGEKGYQQHIWQATLSPYAVVLATNPDAMEETDNRWPSYWASHGRLPHTAQYENVLIALHYINRHPSPSIFEARHYAFTHAYFPKWAFDEVVEKDGWIFGRAGDGYIALYSDMAYEWQTEGPDASQEVIALGNENVWIVQKGRAATDDSFEAFRESISNAPLAVDGLSVEFESPGNGLIAFGWEEPFTVNGEAIPLRDYPRFDNPYTRSAEFGTGLYQFEHGGQILALDFQNTVRLVDGE